MNESNSLSVLKFKFLHSKCTNEKCFENKNCLVFNSCQTHFERSLSLLNSFKIKMVRKINDSGDYAIDAFENICDKIRDKSMSLTSFMRPKNALVGVTGNIENNFEILVEKWKDYLMELKEVIQKTGFELNEKKENVIDEFEELTERLKDTRLETEYYAQRTAYIKEKAIDSFDSALQSCNNTIACIDEYIKCKMQKKKTLIVDEFEDILENLKHSISGIQWTVEEKKNWIVNDFEELMNRTKWVIEDRKNALINDAECAFDNVIEKAEEMIEGGKNEIKAELESLNHALSISEVLLNDFICFSEKIVIEFLKFSEKQVISLMCEGKQKAKVFYNEVVDSLVRGYEDKLLCDNLVLEINSSRYAYNVSLSEVNFHVVRALLTLPGPDSHKWQQLASRLLYFTPILTNYIRTEAAQKDCLLAIEDVASTHPEVFEVMVKIIHWLYEKDILSEDVILEWYHNPTSDADIGCAQRIRHQVRPFIMWLKEAEEQSDSEDEDDSCEE